MPGEYRRLQRRVGWIVGIVAILVIAFVVPLLMLSDFRLSVGQRLGLAPGADAKHLYGASAGAELIIVQQSVPVANSSPYTRFFAVAVARQGDDVVVVNNLNSNKQARLPLANYDLIATSRDRSWLLFVDHGATGGAHAVLWSLATNEVKPLPAGDLTPAIPGDWGQDIAGAAIGCGGVSPHDTWVACITNRGSNRKFFFGDWQLQVSPFGQPNQTKALYRGNGTNPVVGWSGDERYLYFQNETGIWRVAAPSAPRRPAAATPVANAIEPDQPA